MTTELEIWLRYHNFFHKIKLKNEMKTIKWFEKENIIVLLRTQNLVLIHK